MFCIDQKPSYKWPVTVEVPADGGKHEKHSFNAEFKRLSQSRMNEIGEDIRKESSDLSDLAIVDEVLVGWEGIKDGNGNEVPFNEGTKKMVLDIPLVATSIARAWLDSFSKAKVKN